MVHRAKTVSIKLHLLAHAWLLVKAAPTQRLISPFGFNWVLSRRFHFSLHLTLTSTAVDYQVSCSVSWRYDKLNMTCITEPIFGCFTAHYNLGRDYYNKILKNKQEPAHCSHVQWQEKITGFIVYAAPSASSLRLSLWLSQGKSLRISYSIRTALLASYLGELGWWCCDYTLPHSFMSPAGRSTWQLPWVLTEPHGRGEQLKWGISRMPERKSILNELFLLSPGSNILSHTVFFWTFIELSDRNDSREGNEFHDVHLTCGTVQKNSSHAVPR